MFPSLNILEKISQRVKNIPNCQGEYKRKIHYGVFLLGYKAGLRVSEAINFDLNKRTKKGLYFVKSKGKKERLVYVPSKVINELKRQNWKPNSTNRFNFYHFLRKIKRELSIPSYVELTPHTLRRAFTTYYAENGLPLPLLQKLLGHSSIRTTALYWMNIYNDNGDDSNDILIAKNWPENPQKPPTESSSPVKIKLNELPELFISNLPPAEHLTKIKDLQEKLNQIQAKNNHLKSELNQAKEQNINLQNNLNNLNKQKTHAITENKKTQQELTTAKEIIHKLEQELAQERNQRIAIESNLVQQKQINNNLYQQLQIEKETNADLTTKLAQSDYNHTNLLNTYQQAVKDKAIAEQLAHTQKERADYYEKQLKIIACGIYQWQKINYYQKLEKDFETKIVQLEKPPPWKFKS